MLIFVVKYASVLFKSLFATLGWVAVKASKHISVRRQALQCGEFQLCATGQVLVKSIHWIPLRGVSVCVGYRRGGTGGGVIR